MTGKDLEYRPEVLEQAKYEHSPLDAVLSKGLKKHDKVNKVLKYYNDLMYSSVNNFNKYSVSNFNEISSLDSKFGTLNKFYKDFKKLEAKGNNCTEKCINALW